jgi:serine/threonine protein kinase, bacterial
MVHRGDTARLVVRRPGASAEPVAERYDVKKLVGQGPNGSVWRSVHRDSGQEVAVKLLHERFANNPEVRDRLNRECHVLTAFVHPAQVRLRDLVLGDEVALVYELVTGSDLRRLPAFTPAAAAEVVAETAAALAAAHAEGVVHCGIKPANLLLAKGTQQVRITDTRVGRLVRGFRATAARWDTRYTAPEILLGRPPVPATDVYGLGLVWYEMLTGTALGERHDLSRFTPGVGLARAGSLPSLTPAVRRILETCLAEDPAARPSAAQLAEALAELETPAELPGRHVAGADETADRVRDESDDETERGGTARRSEPRQPRNPTAVVAKRAAVEGDRASPDAVQRVAGTGPRARRTLRGYRTWRLLLVTAVLAVGAVVAHNLAGAADRPESATASGARVPVVSPTREQQPTLPSAPTAPTREGATSFVQYWFDLLNYADATGDPAPVLAAGIPGCKVCASDADAIRAAYRDGGSLRGGRYVVRRIIADGFFTPAGTVVVGVVFDRGPRTLVDSAGEVKSELPGITFDSCQVLLTRADDRWYVVEQLCDTPTPATPPG